MANDKNNQQEAELNDELFQEEQLDEVNGGGRYTVTGNEVDTRLP